ncbi:unnamed protein product, partial [Phaeothamnion confervicola]
LHSNAPWRTGWKKEELLKLLAWDVPKLAEESLLWLVSKGRLQESGKWISLPGHKPELNLTQRQALGRVQEMLRTERFSPSTWEDIAGLLRIDAAMWKILDGFVFETGLVVRLVPGIVFLQETLNEGREVLRALGSFTPAQARDALGTTRKFLIPLLEHYDAVGFTQRDGDQRVLKG